MGLVSETSSELAPETILLVRPNSDKPCRIALTSKPTAGVWTVCGAKLTVDGLGVDDSLLVDDRFRKGAVDEKLALGVGAADVLCTEVA